MRQKDWGAEEEGGKKKNMECHSTVVESPPREISDGPGQ